MKIVVFLVTCIAAADAKGCECPDGTFSPEEAAKDAFCYDKVGFVGQVEVKRRLSDAQGLHSQYTGFLVLDSVYKNSTNLQKGAKRNITIKMLDNGCSVALTPADRGSTLLGGTLNPGNTILTITQCEYETWRSHGHRIYTWINQSFCENYRDAKDYQAECINLPQAQESKIAHEPNATFLSGFCFYLEDRRGLENVLRYCSAHYVGSILWDRRLHSGQHRLVKVANKLYKGTPNFTDFKSEIENSEESQYPAYFPVRLPDNCSEIISKRKQIPVRGDVVKEENMTYLNVTSCDRMWYAAEGGQEEVDYLCDKLNGGLSESYRNEWCKSDFVGHIVVVGHTGSSFDVNVTTIYREPANTTTREVVKRAISNNQDCRRKMKNRTKPPAEGKKSAGKKPLSVIGNIDSEGILNVTDCTKTWWNISAGYAADLDKTCGTGAS